MALDISPMVFKKDIWSGLVEETDIKSAPKALISLSSSLSSIDEKPFINGMPISSSKVKPGKPSGKHAFEFFILLIFMLTEAWDLDIIKPLIIHLKLD